MIGQYENELILMLVALAVIIGTQAHFQKWRRPKDFIKASTITYAAIVLLILSTRY